MNFDRIEQALTSRNLTQLSDESINEIMQSEFGCDASIFRTTDQTVAENVFPNEYIGGDIETAYTDYRIRNRYSRPRFCPLRGLISVYRSTSPMGYIRDYVASFKRDLSVYLRNAGIEIPVGVVLDQNTRLDLDPSLIGNEDHLRIQLFTNTAVNGNEVVGLGGYGSTIGMAETSTDINALVAAGWDIISIAIPGNNGGTIQHPIGATLPQSVDPNGRQLIVFGCNSGIHSRSSMAWIVAQCIIPLSSRWGRAEEQAEVSEEARDFYQDLTFISNYLNTSNQSLARARDTVEILTTDINNQESIIAESLRRREEAYSLVRSLETDIVSVSINDAKSMFTIVDRVRDMRPVSSAEVTRTDSGQVVLSFVTHPFGMSYEDRTPVTIAPIEYVLNMSESSYSRGIKLRRAEGNTARYVHPHVASESSGRSNVNVCWGDAGRRPLPEAWARKDWITLIRIMLAWHTQYNNSSPYIYFRELQAYLPTAPRTGWLIPEEVQPEVETATATLSV